jgi:microcystin-dependent protein
MSTPYLGQIQAFSFPFAPKGWAMCNGTLMPIAQNQALFSLLGTSFGGDGRTTFGLPDLRGRFAVSQGTSGMIPGVTGGEENHTLLVQEMPMHTHPVVAASKAANLATPALNFPTIASTGSAYAATQDTTLGPGSSPAGSSQPHNNMPPYLVMNYCIALQGIFPSRS